MTTLVSWLGVDERGPASLYFASDSRITWNGTFYWDHARKLFACRNYPTLLAYCGDVLFPIQVLSQIVEMIDSKIIDYTSLEPDTYIQRIADVLEHSLASYPKNLSPNFQILCASRYGEGLTSSFDIRTINFQDCIPKTQECIPSSQKSSVLGRFGSGSSVFGKYHAIWQKSDAVGTSRSVFSSLCDALRSSEDPLSGGPPQIVGLYRKGPSRTFGVIWNSKRFFYGTECRDWTSSSSLAWYNELFEVCDPETLNRKPNAQAQPRPRNSG